MLVAMQKQQLGQPFRLLTLGVQFSVEVSPLLPWRDGRAGSRAHP